MKKPDLLRQPSDLIIPSHLTLNTGDSIRDRLRHKFIEILQTPLSTEDEELTFEDKAMYAELALKIESALFTKHRLDMKGYHDKARSIVFNLRDKKNPLLRVKLLLN